MTLVLQSFRKKKKEENEMELKVGDRVEIIGKNGVAVAKGTIYNINEFRESSMKYAVNVDGYKEDVLFFGESQLVKIN